jgi:hypothetical protein
MNEGTQTPADLTSQQWQEIKSLQQRIGLGGKPFREPVDMLDLLSPRHGILLAMYVLS